VGAAEIGQPRDNHTRVGDRLFKLCEMDARITGCFMRQRRQRIAIGLRDILSRDFASRVLSTAAIEAGHHPGAGERRRGRSGDVAVTTWPQEPAATSRISGAHALTWWCGETS
jgi:hypothetical protein